MAGVMHFYFANEVSILCKKAIAKAITNRPENEID